MRIAVAGATGRVGRPTVELLEERGHEVVAIARSLGVDVVTGQGLREALAGVECIVDASSGPSPDQESATRFFTAAARNLGEVGAAAGVRRLLVVSIVGADRFTAGYMAAKVAHEREAAAGPLPLLVLRAAQFHELVGQLIEWGRRGDESFLAEMLFQPVAARSAARELAMLATTELVATETAAGVPTLEVAGPRPERLADLARRFLARRGDGLGVREVSDPADPDRDAYRSGALLPGSGAILAGPTFDEWLEKEYPEFQRGEDQASAPS